MNAFNTALFAGCLALSAASAFAQDAMKKDDAMMKKPEMSMKDCKDHMAMAKKDGMKKDDAMMAKDKTCADMMKGDAMKGDAMKKDDAMMKKPASGDAMKH